MALSTPNLRIHAKSAGAIGTAAFTTASFTPSSNSILLAAVSCESDSHIGADFSGDLTITDSAGLSWTKFSNKGNNPSGGEWGQSLAVWWAPVGTAASMTVSFDCGSRSIYMYVAHIWDQTGYNTGSPIGGTIASDAGPLDGAWDLTLSSTPASDSYCFGVIKAAAASATNNSSPGTGYAELSEEDEQFEINLMTEYRTSSTSTTVGWADVTLTGTETRAALGIGFEIKAAAAGVTLRNLTVLGAGV